MTEYCEINIIELPKAIQEYKTNKENEMLQWMMFLDNPENEEVFEIMEENKDIKKAKEELDKMSQDEILWKEALDIEITRMDNEQRMYEAKRDGRAEGVKEGIKEGQQKAKLETAKKLLEENIPMEIIVKATGLTAEEIANLKDK